ncbi:SEC-C metal-binding domain-containing protein [Aeromonas salmonicida]|uniref:SEC-C metal-binding domain-containing protein n=1 Tax=Aeromonas salmonicida TaxID=645 RepID=UPI003D05C7FF
METRLDHRRSACSNFINKVRSRPAQPRGHVPVSIHTKKIGRNEPCHCGSGKKYKHCHGR